MNERKNLLIVLGEWLEQGKSVQRPAEATDGNRWRRFLRWLTPNGGTLLLIAVLLLTQRVWAAPLLGTTNVPGPSATTVNYQGRLADDAGNPITQEGVALSFAIYDAESGGNLIWPLSGPESHVVNISDGLFSVGLGSKTSGGIPTSVWNGDRYLEIAVGSETLEPRELIRSVPIAGMALTVPDGAIGSRQMSPTFFQGFPSGEINVPEGTGDADNLAAIELTVDFPIDATYLIHTTMVTRGGADTRILGRIKDENGNWIGQGIHNSHPIGGMAGSQTGSSTAVHHFSAGSHTLRLIVWGGGGYVRGGSSITVIPFAQAP